MRAGRAAAHIPAMYSTYNTYTSDLHICSAAVVLRSQWGKEDDCPSRRGKGVVAVVRGWRDETNRAGLQQRENAVIATTHHYDCYLPSPAWRR